MSSSFFLALACESPEQRLANLRKSYKLLAQHTNGDDVKSGMDLAELAHDAVYKHDDAALAIIFTVAITNPAHALKKLEELVERVTKQVEEQPQVSASEERRKRILGARQFLKDHDIPLHPSSVQMLRDGAIRAAVEEGDAKKSIGLTQSILQVEFALEELDEEKEEKKETPARGTKHKADRTESARGPESPTKKRKTNDAAATADEDMKTCDATAPVCPVGRCSSETATVPCAVCDKPTCCEGHLTFFNRPCDKCTKGWRVVCDACKPKVSCNNCDRFYCSKHVQFAEACTGCTKTDDEDDDE